MLRCAAPCLLCCAASMKFLTCLTYQPRAPARPPAVEFKGEAKQFSAEEISSMVLSKMKEVAET